MSDVMTEARQAAADPSAAIAWLRAGNERFVAGGTTDRDLLAQAAATADGQHPMAAILGCIDSRVPPELVFDLGIGDAFAARTAGNVVDGDVLGSLEFAAAVAGVKAIVVLGHSACGAVMGACDGVELGHLTGLLAKITPSVEEVAGGGSNPGSSDPDFVADVVAANVRASVTALLERSEVLAGMVSAGDLAVVGAIYDLSTGVVSWLG